VHGLKEISIDTPVLLFTGGLSVLIGIAFGLLPALQSSSVDANESLKESGRGSGAATASNRARSFLIVAEVSLSLILLVGAGLMVKSYVRLQQVDPGFQVDAVQTMKLTLPATRYPEEPQQADFFHQLIDRLKSEPGVSAAAAISRLPLTQGNSDRSLEIDGHPTSDAQGGPLADYRAVSADYFQVVGIRLLAGRDFTEHDDARTPGTAVINETLARLAFPGEEPIGKRLRVDGDQEWLEVIGVCADIKHFGLDAPTHAELYVSYLKFPWPFMTVVARGRGDDAALSNAMRQAVWSIDPDEPVPEIVPMRDLLSRTLAVRRLNMLMMALFGGLALLLATVGIYGVISYSVTQRTHEIGLRIALGARTMDVLKMVVGNGMTLAIVGTAIGLVGAFALTRLMSSLLFAVTPTDLTTFVVVSSGLLIVAFFACFVPARRAAKVDPLISLRYE
jgi:putative ABC transport system permease protein